MHEIIVAVTMYLNHVFLISPFYLRLVGHEVKLRTTFIFLAHMPIVAFMPIGIVCHKPV